MLPKNWIDVRERLPSSKQECLLWAWADNERWLCNYIPAFTGVKLADPPSGRFLLVSHSFSCSDRRLKGVSHWLPIMQPTIAPDVDQEADYRLPIDFQEEKQRRKEIDERQAFAQEQDERLKSFLRKKIMEEKNGRR